jgi:PAP2 superfamily
VIASHYEAIWVQVASYGLASAVGYARLNNNVHWASDVLAGAAIGTFVGRTVVGFNTEHRRLALSPILSPRMQGAELSWLF